MKITFLGAAGTVTGSQTHVQTTKYSVLIDCGMFQGLKELRLRNREPFQFDPAGLDSVLLTHGHLDHCGLLPRLVAQGFRGPIYCSAPTLEVTRLILADSAKIQEEEAEMANRGGYSKHSPAQPLYTVADAEKVFALLQAIEPDAALEISEGLFVEFTNSGHIIGACSISLAADGKTAVFSGDIGQSDDVLMHAPKPPDSADIVIMESTYGDRVHPAEDPAILLEAVVGNALRAGGTVIIPAFAVGRAQTLMYLLWKLRMEDRLPDVPFILDTPMGADMVGIMARHRKWHKLHRHEFEGMCGLFRSNVKYADTIETIFDPRPKVVVAASGMITGGRVLSYMEHYIGKPETCVVIIGFQAEGTRGRQLLEGAREIKIRGKFYPVRANVVQVEGLSAHGDSRDLENWLEPIKVSSKKVCLVHGEPSAATEFSKSVEARFGHEVFIPRSGDSVNV